MGRSLIRVFYEDINRGMEIEREREKLNNFSTGTEFVIWKNEFCRKTFIGKSSSFVSFARRMMALEFEFEFENFLF